MTPWFDCQTISGPSPTLSATSGVYVEETGPTRRGHSRLTISEVASCKLRVLIVVVPLGPLVEVDLADGSTVAQAV